MSYELATASFDPFSNGNFNRFWKFTLLNAGIGLLISVMMLFILDFFGAGGLSFLIMFALVIVGQFAMLGAYAHFRGCHFAVET